MNGQSPPVFSRGAVLGLVLFGAFTFVALLWMIGSGMASGSANNGDAHAGGKGLNGYAALATWLERRGHGVRLSRSAGALDDPGLLVLTPSPQQDGQELAQIVAARRWTGPTMVILPKWLAVAVPQGTPQARKGWVELIEPATPEWPGFLDDVAVMIGRAGDGRAGDSGEWLADGVAGRLPRPDTVLSGQGPRLVPLAVTRGDGRILAAYVQDDGVYPALEERVTDGLKPVGADEALYPLILVFEPDLLNNMAFATPESARFAERLFGAALATAQDETVIFDLTLNGLGRSANLLTLAFTPPYLAATLCLLIAAIAAGWRAFLRFGPARREGQAIAFGKAALVANAAALIRRAGRLHLVASPYADAARERLSRALALPRGTDAAAAEAAIDRALASRHAGSEPFSRVAARLRDARRPHDMLKAAQDLHALERTLTR